MAFRKDNDSHLTKLLGLETRDYPPDHIPDDSPRWHHNRNSVEERRLDATMEVLEDRSRRNDTHVLMAPPNGGASYRVAKGQRASFAAKGFRYLGPATGPRFVEDSIGEDFVGPRSLGPLGTNDPMSKAELAARLADDDDGYLRSRIEAELDRRATEGLERILRGERAQAPPMRGGIAVELPYEVSPLKPLKKGL